MYTRLYSARQFDLWRRLFADSAFVIRVSHAGNRTVMHIDQAVRLYERHAADYAFLHEEWSAVEIRPSGNLALIKAHYRLSTDRNVREGTDLLTMALEDGEWKIVCLAYEQTFIARVPLAARPQGAADTAAPGLREDHENLADWLSHQSHLNPQSVAIHLPKGKVTFRGLDLLAWRAVALLSNNGVVAGDVLALSFTGELAGLVAMLATARIGATAYWIPPGASQFIRTQMLADARATALLSDNQWRDEQSLRQIPVDPVALARSDQPVVESLRDPAPTVPWLVITGSGSTGNPKKIPVTHAQYMAQMRIYNEALELTPADRVASLLSMDSVVTRERYLDALFAGASLVLDGSRQPDTIGWLRRQAVSVLWSTVLHAEALLQRGQTPTRPELPSLRAFILGSSTVSEALRKRLHASLTDRLHVYYGTNEIGLVTICRPADLFESAQTVGFAVPDIRLEIVDPHDQALQPGQIGLVRIGGPGMVSGYLDDQEATGHAFRDGWFYPSDLARLRLNGSLDYCGRADHMMIMDGINVYPAEIEKVLTSHPAVRDAAAVPIKHPIHQDIPIGAVSLHPGVDVTEQALLAYARERLGAHRPHRILILDRIPRSEQGKLLRAELNSEIIDSLRPVEPSGNT